MQKNIKVENNLQWQDGFDDKVISQSKEYIDCIEDISVHGGIIDANLKKSSHFHVHINIKDKSIGDMFCTCPKKSHCKHEAAVLSYVEQNNLIQKENDFQNLVKSVPESLLREYLIYLLSKNQDLKEEFIRKFKKQPIDSKPYFDKLDRIIDNAKGRDYVNFGYYNIDVLATGFYDFILDEISDLMDICQYELVFELLDVMAGALNDEMYVDEDSWYDACEEYLHVAYKLEETYVLSDNQLDKLAKNTYFMSSHM